MRCSNPRNPKSIFKCLQSSCLTILYHLKRLFKAKPSFVCNYCMASQPLEVKDSVAAKVMQIAHCNLQSHATTPNSFECVRAELQLN